MGQIFHLITSRVRRWRLGLSVFAFCLAWPLAGWGATTPAAVPAGEPAPLPPDSPEMACRDTLATYLQKLEPKTFEALSAQTFDRAQVSARIKLFESSNRAQDLADAYLYYLVKLPPDPKDYLETLFRLASVLVQQDKNAGLLTLLFELADYFPPTAQPAQQIRLIQSEYLLKVGGPQAALMLLHRVADDKMTVPSVRMVAAGRAGFLHENLGQTDQAIKLYHTASTDLTAGPQANEALLRGALLELELGRMDEALADFANLKKVPDEVQAQSPASSALKDFADLVADPAQARAFWAFHEQWQPLWTALLQRLGIQPAPTGTALIAPYVDNYRQLAAQAGLAAGQSDAATYFQLVDKLFRSGRWNPADLGRAVDMLYRGISLEAPFTDDILAFGEALEKAAPQSNKELLKQLIQSRVSVLVDPPIAKVAVARDIAKDALQKYGADGANGQALARLYGYAVIKSNTYPQFGDEAARILAATLADPAAHGSQRALAIAVLSDLYTALQRENDARNLIEKELSRLNDTTDPGGRFRNALQVQLNNLRQRSVQAAGLDAGLAAWWIQFHLPWYDFVNAPERAGALSTADDPAVQVARDFALALNSNAALAVRAASLQAVWEAYPDVLPSANAVVAAASAFIARPELPQDLRYTAWLHSVQHLFWAGQRTAAEKLLALAPSGGATFAEDRADLDLWDQYLAQPMTVKAQQEFADKILALPVVRRAALLLGIRIVNVLASQNDTTAAQAFFDKLGKAALDPAARQSFENLQPEFAGMLETFTAVNPVAEALRKIVLEAQATQADKAQLPAAWRDMSDILSPNLSLLTQSEAREGLLAVIRDRLPYGRYPLQAFLDYAETLSFDAADSALRMKLFETALRLARRDQDRFYAALFTSVVDFDDTLVAKHGWTVLAPSRAAEFPKAASFILYYETLMKWRTGVGVDPAKAFGPLDAKTLDPFKLRLALDYYLQHEDKAVLQKLVDARPEADFLQAPVIAAYVRAVRLLGREEALKHAVEAARLELAKDVVVSWAHPDTETATPVFELAKVLNEPQAYPRAWASAVIGAVRNENARDLLSMEDGQVQQDWNNVLNAANSYLQRNPTSYDAYWRKAEALINLGRRAEAVEPLRTYVKFSKNEEEYPGAVELLKKIEAENPKK